MIDASECNSKKTMISYLTYAAEYDPTKVGAIARDICLFAIDLPPTSFPHILLNRTSTMYLDNSPFRSVRASFKHKNRLSIHSRDTNVRGFSLAATGVTSLLQPSANGISSWQTIMNRNYVSAFRSFRDEFRIYKQSPSMIPPMMDQSLLSQGLSDGSGTPDNTGEPSCAASLSLASSSQRVTPILTPPLDSTSVIGNRSSTAEGVPFSSNDLKNSPEEVQVAENNGHPAPPVQVPPQSSRKGHKKSRQGCYNCKRRKIKV